MVYTLTIDKNIAATDFTSLFPLDISFKNSNSNDYYILTRSGVSYENDLFSSSYTYLNGDIALLENNIYVVFRQTTLFESKSIYIGTINDFDNILNNQKNQTDDTDTSKLLFESQNICYPYILAINNEKDIKIQFDNIDSNKLKYGIINFSTKGTKSLDKAPSIYLNNSYLSDDCSIESDGYSVKCKIRYDKWYEKKVEKESNKVKKYVKYRVN